MSFRTFLTGVACVGLHALPWASAATQAPDARHGATTPEAVLGAYYDAHTPRTPDATLDTARLRALFWPAARIVQAGRDSAGTAVLLPRTVDAYLVQTAAYAARRGFAERELARRVTTYGGLAHAWSAYEAAHGRDSTTVRRVRGLNSFQLVLHGTRWYITELVWANEQVAGPLPPALLPPP